jgi:hypothetical protein
VIGNKLHLGGGKFSLEINAIGLMNLAAIHGTPFDKHCPPAIISRAFHKDNPIV